MARTARKTRKLPRHPNVSLRRVMAVMRTIHNKRKSGHFMASAKRAKVKITVPPKTIRFMQKYINDNNLAAHADTKGVVLCKKPYSCPDIAR